MAERAAEKALKSPAIIDLGRASGKRIKALRKGEGKLADEINDCITELQASGKISNDAQPIVVIVEKKCSKSLFPFK